MLQSMKHRGPDSTGYALYGPDGVRRARLRYKLADANDPRDFDYARPARASRREVRGALALARREGPLTSEAETEYAYRVTLAYDGDLKALVDYVEDIPGRRGALDRPLARDRQGSRRRRDRVRPVRARRLQGHPRHRPRPHGDRVRRRHLGRAPLLGVPVLRRGGRAQRPADELLLLAPPPRAQRATASSPSATPRSSRSTWPRRCRRARRSRRLDDARASRSSTASSRTCA